MDAYAHYKSRNGDHLAAAITYFSFLALFPVALLGVSVAGFILFHDQHLLTRLTTSITSNVPGEFGGTLQQVLNTAIANRTAVGIVGLVGVLLAGLGWIDNLRTAIDSVWGIATVKRSFIATKAADATVLGGLGLAVVLSLGLTVGGTAATGQLLRAVHLDGVPTVSVFTRAVGILLALGADMLVFGWLIVRLPDAEVDRRTELRTALLAAVGFEVLKIVGTIYVARIAHSPTAGIFGSVVGVLIWIDLVARYLLFCVAWAATVRPVAATAAVRPVAATAAVSRPDADPGRSESADSVQGHDRRPLTVAAGLFAAGAAVGAAGFAALRRRRVTGRE